MFEIDEVDYAVILPDGTRRVFGVNDQAEDFCGFLTKPTREVEVSNGITSLSGLDGGVIRSIYAKPQTHVWDVAVIDPDPLARHAKVESIMDLNIGMREDLAIEWTDSTGIKKRIDGVRIRNYITPDPEPEAITKNFQITFIAPDPFIYSEEQHSNVDSEGQAPALDPENQPQSINVFNAGNCPVYPVLEIRGPFQTITITNSDDSSQVIAINCADYEWVENDFLLVDFHPLSRSLLLNGSVNKFGWLDQDLSVWFGIRPGTGQQLVVDATFEEDAELENQSILCVWQSGWY